MAIAQTAKVAEAIRTVPLRSPVRGTTANTGKARTRKTDACRVIPPPCRTDRAKAKQRAAKYPLPKNQLTLGRFRMEVRRPVCISVPPIDTPLTYWKAVSSIRTAKTGGSSQSIGRMRFQSVRTTWTSRANSRTKRTQGRARRRLSAGSRLKGAAISSK